MNTVKQSHLILERGQVLKLETGAQAMTLDCAKGTAWVTASKDPQDYVLKSGERLELPKGTAIVIEGLADRLEIEIQLCA